MYAIEFKTEIKKNTIKIPLKYKGIRSRRAKVIILTSDNPGKKNRGDSLSLPEVFLNPIEVSGYSEFDRNEIYEK